MNGQGSTAVMPRYHALDALRAVMMLLGLVLHTSINYLPAIPASANWPYQDARTSLVFGWLIAFIHIFRMPVFFVVAGFFAAFVHGKRGAMGFLRHRFARVGVPLLCAWPVLYAVLVGSAPYAQTFTAAPPPHPEIAVGVDLLHLWFLYYLLVFCVVAVLADRALRHTPSSWRERSLRAFNGLVQRGWGIVVLAGMSALLLMPMESWHFDTASSLLPAPYVVAGYGVFFAFGWLLFQRRKLVEGFESRAWTYFGAGFLCHGFYLVLFDQGFPDPTNPEKVLLAHPMYAPLHAAGMTDAAAAGTHMAAMAALALSIWLLIYGFLGLFLRYLGQPSAVWRYLADASYWMYLVHLPLAVWLPVLVGRQPLPAGLKFGLSLAGVATLTLITYHYLVRATFIGYWLNGRRHPRTVPWRSSEAATEGVPTPGRRAS